MFSKKSFDDPSFDEAFAVRESLAEGFQRAIEKSNGEDHPFLTEVDGQVYVKASVLLTFNAAVMENVPPLAIQSELLNDQFATGALDAYSKVVTMLDVFYRVASGLPTNPERAELP